MSCSLTIICLLLLIGHLAICLMVLCSVFHFSLWYRLRLGGNLE